MPEVIGHGEFDLSKELTVFLIHVDEPTVQDARAALEGQTCRFQFEEIANITPMSWAFSRMAKQCRTPYYIEVDADMILGPTGIVRLYRRMLRDQEDDPRCAMTAMSLWDAHLGMPMIGLKIYDHAVFLDYPYRDVQSCEVNQLNRIVKDGWTWKAHLAQYRDSPDVVGEHVTANTPWQAFERYRDLTHKQRKFGHSPWVDDLPTEFLGRLQRGTDQADRDLWSLLGCIVGTADDIEAPRGEKDASVYEKDPVYLRLQALFSLGEKGGNSE